MPGFAIAAWICLMSWLSKAMCASRFLILFSAYVPSFFTTSSARPFAAQAAILPFFDCTLTLTSGLIVAPLFEETPLATDCVEIPLWNSAACVWQRFATVLSTDWLLITCPTDDGFVCGFCTGAPPAGVYGWPR